MASGESWQVVLGEDKAKELYDSYTLTDENGEEIVDETDDDLYPEEEYGIDVADEDDDNY